MKRLHAPELIPGLYGVEILTAGRSAYPLHFVRLTYDGDRPPNALISSLEAIGFVANARSGLRAVAADTLMVEDLSKPGTGLFGAWTAEESAEALADLQAALLAAGLPSIIPSKS